MKIPTQQIAYLLLVLFSISCSKNDETLPEAIKSSNKQITSFVFLLNNNPIDINIVATIDEENKTITAKMPLLTDLTALLPEMQLSEFATVDRTTVQNFNEPVEYIVTAEDGSEVIYTVTISNATGSYKLTSILSSRALDPSVSGVFTDFELIDNIDCSSMITINSNNTFSWNFLKISQIAVDSFFDGITSYEPITCAEFENGIDNFTIIDDEIVFDAYPAGYSTQILDDSSIEVTTLAELVILNSVDRKRKEFVLLTFIYKK